MATLMYNLGNDKGTAYRMRAICKKLLKNIFLKTIFLVKYMLAWKSGYAVGLAIHIFMEKNVCDVGSVDIHNDMLWWENTKLKLRICFWANITQFLLSRVCPGDQAEGDCKDRRWH